MYALLEWDFVKMPQTENDMSGITDFWIENYLNVKAKSTIKCEKWARILGQFESIVDLAM